MTKATINLVLAVIVCLTLTSCTQRVRLYKLIMPGKHMVYLQPKAYQFWIFRTWKSKNVFGQAKEIIYVTVTDGQSRILRKEPLSANLSENYEPTKNDGRPEFSIDIKQAGQYEISSKNRCVVVVVPPEAVYVNLGSNFAVAYIDDDSDFEP